VKSCQNFSVTTSVSFSALLSADTFIILKQEKYSVVNIQWHEIDMVKSVIKSSISLAVVLKCLSDKLQEFP